MGSSDDALTRKHNPLEWLDDKFSAHIAERRREPREDVLTQAGPSEISRRFHSRHHRRRAGLAAFLFAAGQETTTKLLSFGMRVMAERPEIPTLLREDRSRIPAFVEETLRTESPVKSHFRMARTSTSIGDIRILAASNGDATPRRQQSRRAKSSRIPTSSASTGPNVREHVAFGRETDSCPGAPLARAEGRISFNRILDRMSDISIGEAAHGPPAARHYTYEPTWQMRGLTELHLEFNPIR